MPNVYEQFKALVAGDPTLIAKVVSVGDTFCMVEYPGGALARVLGVEAVDSKVYVRGNLIIGPAPNLPVSEIVISGL